MFGKIVYSTFIFNDLDIMEMLHEMKLAGIEYIELFGGEYTHWDPSTNFNKISLLIKEYGIRCESFHLPIEPLAGICEKDLRRNLGIMRSAILFAANLGSKNTVLHAELTGDKINAENKKALFESIRTLADFSEKQHLELLLENIPSFGQRVYGSKIDEIIEMIDEANSKNIKICLDTGHSNVNGDDFIHQMKKSMNLIRTIHLSDNHGMRSTDPKENDEHLPPCEGLLPWDDIFKEIKDYKETIELVVEVSTRVTPSTEQEVLKRGKVNTEALIFDALKAGKE